jgi:hypothetical protein
MMPSRLRKRSTSDAIPSLADKVGDSFCLADQGAGDFRFWDKAAFTFYGTRLRWLSPTLHYAPFDFSKRVLLRVF